MTKALKLYSLSTCPRCKDLKRLLDQKGAAYTEITVDKLDSGEQWLMSKELKAYNPEATYPTLVVSHVFTSVDEAALDRLLGE